MGQHRPILIACPQYGRLVRGTYACDPAGGYVLGPEGRFLLNRVRCAQQEGRCMETLCALHRFNRGGPGTWFPGRVLAAPQRRRRTPRPEPPVPAPRQASEPNTDILC
jgi:hypothetical protein